MSAPFLLHFLRDKYKQVMDVPDSTVDQAEAIDDDEALAGLPKSFEQVDDFINWAELYLRGNPPALIAFDQGSSYNLQLADKQIVNLSPVREGVPPGGKGYVAVTGGPTQTPKRDYAFDSGSNFDREGSIR